MKLFLLFTVFLRLTYTAHSYLGSRKEANTAYVITATAPKQIQFAQLIRLGNTLNLNNKLQWVIVSGSPLKVNVLRYMERLRIPVRVVVDFQGSTDANLNAGLKWVLQRTKVREGFVTFSSPDYIFDADYYDEIHAVRDISLWRVGNLDKEQRFQSAFTTKYLRTNPVWARYTNNITNYLSTLQPQNNSGIELYDDQEEILVWKHPFVVIREKANKSKWNGYENTNMDVLIEQIY